MFLVGKYIKLIKKIDELKDDDKSIGFIKIKHFLFS